MLLKKIFHFILVLGCLSVAACNSTQMADSLGKLSDTPVVSTSVPTVEDPTKIEKPTTPATPTPPTDPTPPKIDDDPKYIPPVFVSIPNITLGKNINTLKGLAQKCGASGDIDTGEKMTDHCFNHVDTGGDLRPYICGSGLMVVGLNPVRAEDDTVGSLQFKCAYPSWDGIFSAAPSTDKAGETSEGTATTSDGLKNCEKGYVAMGIYGKSGDKLDSIGLICAPLEVSKDLPSEQFVNKAKAKKMSTRGGSGGDISYEVSCPNGYVMTGGDLWINGKTLVGTQSIYCAAVNVSYPEPIFPSDPL